MRINADFSQRAVVTPADWQWVRSPESGVDRVMLDRIGDEVARATSIVAYAAGSRFPRHEHAKGEEFLVLDGVFSDESGHYGAGAYVRNPPGSAHAPFSREGCRILVKLRQFRGDDLAQFSVDTRDESLWSGDTLTLHEFGSERVYLRRLAPGGELTVDAPSGGAEVFVVSGLLRDQDTDYAARSWLRFPADSQVMLTAAEPSEVWVKTGHLAE